MSKIVSSIGSPASARRTIDPLLKSQGWKIVPFDEKRNLDQLSNCAIEEYDTENGPADYVLCIDGRIVAVVEAKKLTLGPQNVLTQAERNGSTAVKRRSRK